MEKILNFLESKNANKILLVALAIIVVYCLIPKWEYVYMLKESVEKLPTKPFNERNLTEYKYNIYKCNTITGNCLFYNPQKEKWVKIKENLLFFSASIGYNEFIDKMMSYPNDEK